MTAPRPSRTRIGNHELHPETQMLNFGYDPELSEGAVKPPVFLTSTFVFHSAEEGRDFFDYTAGRREPLHGEAGEARARQQSGAEKQQGGEEKPDPEIDDRPFTHEASPLVTPYR